MTEIRNELQKILNEIMEGMDDEHREEFQMITRHLYGPSLIDVLRANAGKTLRVRSIGDIQYKIEFIGEDEQV